MYFSRSNPRDAFWELPKIQGLVYLFGDFLNIKIMWSGDRPKLPRPISN